MSNSKIIQHGLPVVLFTLLLGAIGNWFTSSYAPKTWAPLREAQIHQGPDKIDEALESSRLQKHLDDIHQLGSRSVGQKGHQKAFEHIKKTYQDAGLSIFEQELQAIHPTLKKGRLSQNGKTLDHKIYPLFPNQLQPGSTGAHPLKGELFLVDDESIRKAKNFSDKIALIDLSKPAPNITRFVASRLAALGFKALIVTHADGMEALIEKDFVSLWLKIPTPFVRVYTDPSILSRVGQEVELEAVVKYDEFLVKNIAGVLKGGEANDEALVVPVSYDGYSLLPDHNAGSYNAVQMAIQFGLIDGLTHYAGKLQRDIIFVATAADMMAEEGITHFTSALGRNGEQNNRLEDLKLKHSNEKAKVELITNIISAFRDPKFAADHDSTQTVLQNMPEEAQALIKSELNTVLRKEIFHIKEKLSKAKIIFEKAGGRPGTPEYHAFRLVMRQHEEAVSQAGYPLLRILKEGHQQPREALLNRLSQLIDWHTHQERRTQQDIAINQMFSKYRNVVIASPAVLPSTRKAITFSCGWQVKHGAQAETMRNLLEELVQDTKSPLTVQWLGRRHSTVLNNQTRVPLHSRGWSYLSYPAFSFITPGGPYETFTLPTVQNYQFSDFKDLTFLLGRLNLALAQGVGQFNKTKYHPTYQHHGKVVAASIGSSAVPNFPVDDAIVTPKFSIHGEYTNIRSGRFNLPIYPVNPYGEYNKELITHKTGNRWTISMDAARYNEHGIIDYIKDEGATAQRIYRSMNLRLSSNETNLVLYRGNALAIYDRVNPQTLKPYTGIGIIKQSGLSALPSTNKTIMEDGIVDFVPPEDKFFITLKAGSADNEKIQETRAFILNVPEDFQGDPDKEIDGLGFLGADTPSILNVPAQVASSMRFLNEKRSALQETYGMLDQMTATFNERAKELHDKSKSEGLGALEKNRLASQAVTYATLNHPVIRSSISEAIWGVLWYMGLLIPFVFFFEKLVFGYSDVRKALGVQAIIFLVVFALLRLLHPAFEMIRSSMMILLGFVIILISGGITIILSGKFKENLEALQQSQGKVKGAEANTMGIAITAFVLGLNNMHRRKVRTGLTCATLVLLTFVMISFTSVQNDIVDKTVAVAKAPFNGILIKEENFAGITGGVLSSLTERFGHRYKIHSRQMYLGIFDRDRAEAINPSINAIYREQQFKASSALLLNEQDPILQQIKLTKGSKPLQAGNENSEVLIPYEPARQLGLIDAQGDFIGAQPIILNDKVHTVVGTFNGEELNRLTALDGQSLLPFDAEALISPDKTPAGVILAQENDPKISGDLIIIGLIHEFNAPVAAGSSTLHPTNIAAIIDMRGAPVKTAREDIQSYIEQSGRETSYGLDGISYLGQQTRERSLAGLVDMLIPLILAGLTVLNTMKGSVYERRDEIFVYNAVGIAPKYIFFMFMAEATVYAVVGSLMGYLLSQGTGRLLTALDLTMGLNMNFTSLATVYASWTIAAAVFLSTWFPAKDAMEIAEPSEDSGWQLPEPDGDQLSFDLPFTFGHLERISVLAFFHKFMDNHGEGSAGPFFASPSTLGISDRTDDLADGAYIPTLSCDIWMKPFDLGVSQNLVLEIATDKDTGEYISRVHLTRLSGTVDAWKRLNPAFVAHLRQHFLHWRAVDEETKNTLFVEAKELMSRHMEVSNV